MRAAVARSDTNMVKFLVEHGCPFHGTEVQGAASNNDVQMLKCLAAHGCSLDNPQAVSTAVSMGKLKALQYLVDHGGNLDKSGDLPRRAGDHVDVLAYLLQLGCELNMDEAVARAVQLRQRRTRAFLESRRRQTAWQATLPSGFTRVVPRPQTLTACALVLLAVGVHTFMI
eukprot:m.492263 g.492263  ORF g.492263 m.492263 type:complete len:171 (-) comp31932_c0_seq1:36-548(-)